MDRRAPIAYIFGERHNWKVAGETCQRPQKDVSIACLRYKGKKTSHGLEDQIITYIKWEERQDSGRANLVLSKSVTGLPVAIYVFFQKADCRRFVLIWPYGKLEVLSSLYYS
ncbi:MAG: hypothetical protein ACLPX5_06385 [Dissulfurispiraceae bacterium]